MFGRFPNQVAYTFRHVEAAGLERNAMQTAISSDIVRLGANFPNNPYNGSIVVNGIKIDYVAYKLPDGTVNIGRITPPR